jgi:hypothetical protein
VECFTICSSSVCSHHREYGGTYFGGKNGASTRVKKQPNPIAKQKNPKLTCSRYHHKQTHVHRENFRTEIDQYLTVLAYNKGTLMTSAIEDDVSMPKATKHSSRRRRESLEKEAAAVREAQYRKEQLHSKVKMTR